ncbi:hypothetical protein ATK74_0839 [Propionicimonas paludicola]|uniref:Uncharacterized protein n=1 Tax=Propionicimonas paludicola TaxID=185243 RepID=A0A2A9CQE4_9ACTN|nr:hypothetical protein [Propionicimonas paludicola]PFG16305.1 hypothetical protein ATK74_0839 [Propionicimonas paludicola]
MDWWLIGAAVVLVATLLGARHDLNRRAQKRRAAAAARKAAIAKYGPCKAQSNLGGHECHLPNDDHDEHECRCNYRWTK